MEMNSMSPGLSSTVNVTSRIAVKPLSYVFPTLLNETTGGATAAGAVDARAGAATGEVPDDADG